MQTTFKSLFFPQLMVLNLCIFSGKISGLVQNVRSNSRFLLPVRDCVLLQPQSLVESCLHCRVSLTAFGMCIRLGFVSLKQPKYFLSKTSSFNYILKSKHRQELTFFISLSMKSVFDVYGCNET